MLFGDDPCVNLICGCAGIAGIPTLLFWLLYRVWKWVWPRLLDDARDAYRHVTGPDESV